MKITNNIHHILFRIAGFVALSVLLMHPAPSTAHDLSKYASSSVLAEGKWGKVAVTTTGMQFVSAATLRQLGFNDPTKVNVYGFGGRVAGDWLMESDPDDLPILPSVRSAAGIWFFGHDYIHWTPTGKAFPDALPYSHRMHPYAEESWYFLSDREIGEYELPVAQLPDDATEATDSFTQMLLLEEELIHPSESGYLYLGPDMRGSASKNFNFTLTDRAENEVSVKAGIGFAASKPFTMFLSVGDGEEASSMNYNNPAKPPASTDPAYVYTLWAQASGNTTADNVNVNIRYACGGDLRLYRLDYIELGYSRKLQMRDNQLFFNVISQGANKKVRLTGATSDTRIWDVTDPTHPEEVKFSLSGSTATFNAPSGTHEYIAFNSGQGGYAVKSPTSVGNQDIHSLNTPDLLIISPAEYLSAANRLAAHHVEHDGFTVHVLCPEDIYNEFSSGTPDVGAFRRLMKMWYDRGLMPSSDNGGTRGRLSYCLIMSRPTYDNKLKMEQVRNCGYPRIPMWQMPVQPSSATTKYANDELTFGCDDYIAMLADGENKKFEIDKQEINVAVGRMPVKSLQEANEVVDKYIKYVTEPDPGRWRNKILLIADDNEYEHLDQSEKLLSKFTASSPRSDDFEIEKLYIDLYPLEQGSIGFTNPQAKARLLKEWNDGVGFMSYIGHASPVGWTHEDLLNWTDIRNFSNSRLPFLYAATCEFARIDQDTPSGAEVLWSNPNGGIISTLCPLRKVYIANNGPYSEQIGSLILDTENPHLGRRIGDIMRESKNRFTTGTLWDRGNSLRFLIVGNPAMRLPMPSNRVIIEELDGKDFSESAEAPVLQARGKTAIKGAVISPEGTTDTDFNGTIEIVLYDAEKVLETLGQGDKGRVMNYNDHTNILFRGITKVTAGEWNTTLLLPSEIEDLYTPAKIVMYAYSNTGTEAHGATRNVYVYGFDESAAEDNTGPEIQYFALNRNDFEQGGIVNSSPVVMAKMSDESGINISDAGIGHQISLVLDGRTWFEDVNSYYTPDPSDFTAGSILYPLPDLEAGEHKLKLTVWDNANNSASAELTFTVAASKRPEIYDLRTDVNPAREDVNFTLSTDRPRSQVECTVEVFDLNGRRVWVSSRNTTTDIQAGLKIHWDLCDTAGVRVPRGIYLYRATVTAPDGTYATSSRRLAVTAQ